MANFLQKIGNRLGLREDSMANIDAALQEAGIGAGDMALLGDKQIEKLRNVVIDGEIADVLAVLRNRVGTDFTSSEENALVKILTAAVKRNKSRLADMMAEIRNAGSAQQSAEIGALRQQNASLQAGMDQLQAVMGQLASAQAALLQNQAAASAPAPVSPNGVTKRADGLFEDESGNIFALMGGQLTPIEEPAAPKATAKPRSRSKAAPKGA